MQQGMLCCYLLILDKSNKCGKSFTICFAAFILIGIAARCTAARILAAGKLYPLMRVLHDTDHTVDGFIKMVYTNNLPGYPSAAYLDS